MKDTSSATARSGVKSGPHVEKRLNASFVRNAPPGRHLDGGGLFLQVDKSGARRWLLRTMVNGKRREFGLGSAKLVSLAEAREKATELRKVARSGGNPKVRQREKEGRATTFEELAYVVHNRKFKDKKHNGKHIAQWIRTLETYAFPVLKDLSVEDVHQDDIEAVLDPIWTSKPETARRVLQRISTVFDHACGRGLRTRGNPATGLRGQMRDQDDAPKHFEALDYGKLPELMGLLDASSSIGAKALKFTVLTAVRSWPTRAATWDQFTSDLTSWKVPASYMKSRKDFEIPLSIPARQLLFELRDRRSKGSDLVFPSPSDPTRTLSENTMLKRLQSHFPGVTVHGMRAAFRTWATEVAEVPDDVAEISLAHSIGSKTVRAYKRTDLFEQRSVLLEKWAMWVTGEWEWFTEGYDIEDEITRRLYHDGWVEE
ncbi:integrase arm-type DNA-binding domain-containing protein [Ruegeria sp. HKCCC2117]|uniref:tyrosine-type recombinase/integrase n=1 Tax=Ruegeria sp. HKCCC2117 TaxID=2682992 RepID=UPI0014880F54|nr:integrase arm-type DNA-binding domain-containing protein [Ruegeria sp. HKCCC2117]